VTAPRDLRYTKSHEWVRIDGDIATFGLSDYAQAELGDITYLELPEVGSNVTQSEPFGVVESVKAASDIYAPVAGEVVGANDALSSAPEKVNEDAFGAWMYRIKPDNPGDVDRLLDAAAYEKAASA